MTAIDYLDKPYLEVHKPRRSQFRTGRRAPVRSVNVIHTGESGTDMIGPDPKAENVARFIADRKDPGSYHLLGDSDSGILLVDLDNEAFGDGTGSNPWAVHLALAMNSVDWSRLTVARRDEFLATLVDMAIVRARWDLDHGRKPPAGRRLLTKAESEKAGASGFIGHGDRDPARRSDPGKAFPWSIFLPRYSAALQHLIATYQQRPVGTPVEIWQQTIGVTVDDDFGPKTLEESLAQHSELLELRAEVAQLKVVPFAGSGALAEDAANWRNYAVLVQKAANR